MIYFLFELKDRIHLINYISPFLFSKLLSLLIEMYKNSEIQLSNFDSINSIMYSMSFVLIITQIFFIPRIKLSNLKSQLLKANILRIFHLLIPIFHSSISVFSNVPNLSSPIRNNSRRELCHETSNFEKKSAEQRTTFRIPRVRVIRKGRFPIAV